MGHRNTRNEKARRRERHRARGEPFRPTRRVAAWIEMDEVGSATTGVPAHRRACAPPAWLPNVPMPGGPTSHQQYTLTFLRLEYREETHLRIREVPSGTQE